MAQEPSSDLTIYTEEQEAQANNPYRKIAKKIGEMANDESLGIEDRDGLRKLAATFIKHQQELALRAQHLIKSGIDPETDPYMFYLLCNDIRNEIFLPAGIFVYFNDPRFPDKKADYNLSSATAKAILEELGFVNKGESMQSVADRIEGQWQRNPKVMGFYLEKLDPNSHSRVVGSPSEKPDEGHGMIWIENKSLGEGIVAGIGIPMGKGANGQVAIGDTITDVTIRVEGRSSGGVEQAMLNLLRCAP